jgi:phosphoribosylanthranilate isomerase
VIRVNICGITSIVFARGAVEAGADALGFIFVEKTPRYVAPRAAAAIIAQLPPFVTAVGIFWDHAPAHVKAVAAEARLGALQFHGDEKPDDLAAYDLPVIKTIKLPPASTIEGLGYRVSRRIQGAVLQQGRRRRAPRYRGAVERGEIREPLEWRHAAHIVATRKPAETEGDSLRRAHRGERRPGHRHREAYGVDVNSGVEARPGVKDPDKVRRFLAAARSLST